MYPQSMVLSRNKKNNVYPCKPQFYFIKVGFKGVKIIQAFFRDGILSSAWANAAETRLILLFSLENRVRYFMEKPPLKTLNLWVKCWTMFSEKNKKNVAYWQFYWACHALTITFATQNSHLTLKVPITTAADDNFVFLKNPSCKKAMSRWAGIGRWAWSEVYLLVNLFENSCHNAIRHLSCFSGKTSLDIDMWIICFLFVRENKSWHVICLLGRWFTWNVDLFTLKNKKIRKLGCHQLQILLGTL